MYLRRKKLNPLKVIARNMKTKTRNKMLNSNSNPSRHSYLCRVTTVSTLVAIMCIILSVQGAQDDISTSINSKNQLQKCGANNKLCDPSRPPSPSLVGTPRSGNDSLVQFFSWLFGSPAPSTSAVSSKKSKKNESSLAEDGSNTTSKTVVYSVPVGEGNQDMAREGRTGDIDKGENGNVRLRRESYKPIKVPYTKKTVTTAVNNPVNPSIFERRQLLLNPLEQQQAMMAIQAQQQQQAAVAAAAQMLQQQQILNGNRYATLLDDYDDRDKEDDEESDEDSDEFDDFPRFAPPPLIEHHHMYFRRGAIEEDGAHATEGRQRREDADAPGNKQGARNKKGTRNRVAAIKSGHWLLDDYDLHSEFYDRPQERGNLPQSLRDGGKLGDRIELDELEHYNSHLEKEENAPKRFRDSLPRQEEGDAGSSSPPMEDSTEATASESESSTAAAAEESDGMSSTESSSMSSSTTEGGESGSSSPLEMSSVGAVDLSSTEGSLMNMTMMGLGNTTDVGLSSTSLAPGLESTTPGDLTNMTMTTPSMGGNSTGSGMSTTPSPNNPPPPYKATLNCKCGTQSVRGAGIGDGTVVRFHVNPWLMEITSTEVKGRHLCSGSLINDRYVLTSKTCVGNASSPSSLRVISGLQSKQSKMTGVKNVIMNPKADLALLQLNAPLKPTSTVRPICLPIGKRYAGPYSSGNLVTFKKINDKTPIQMVDTEVAISQNSTNCTSTRNGEGKLCAGPPGSAKCGGDTGGVLMVYRGGYSYEQIGVVSDTVGCRPKNMSGVYTDIRKRTRWILMKSQDGNYCKNPKVTSEDLASTTRVGDAAYQINDDDGEDDDDAISEEVDHRKEDYGSEEFEDNNDDEADDVSKENE